LLGTSREDTSWDYSI